MLQLAKGAKFYFNPEVDVLIRERQGSLTSETRSDGTRLTMSSALYRDHLRLYLMAERANFLSRSELDQLREWIVSWNRKQLSDLLCGRYFKEVQRILVALAGAGVDAAPLVSSILTKTFAKVAVRAGAKAFRITFGRAAPHEERLGRRRKKLEVDEV